MEKNRTKINVLDAESKLQACSGIWIPSRDVINDVSNADWFQSCGLFPSCHGRGGRLCDLPAQPCPPKTRPPCRAGHGSNPRRGWALGGLALAAPSSLCSHCPDPTEITSIPFVPECSLSQSIYYFFFLMGKGVAASFHSNTYAHNTVCSCHHCWRGWLLLCLAGTVVVSFCPCSEGTPLVLQRWRRWARNKPGNILQVLPVSLLCVCL